MRFSMCLIPLTVTPGTMYIPALVSFCLQADMVPNSSPSSKFLLIFNLLSKVLEH